MPGEMLAAINKFFAQRHYKMKRRSSQKKIDYFSVSTIVDPLKGARANISSAFLLNTTLLGSSGYEKLREN